MYIPDTFECVYLCVSELIARTVSAYGILRQVIWCPHFRLFVSRAHFAARSFQISKIAFSHDKY